MLIIARATGKGKEVDSYSAYTELPANTPHLPFLRISIR